MAINWRKQLPLQQARATRMQLPRYLQLDGGRYLIAAALILAFLSLLSLGQTGRLATRGYELGRLKAYEKALLREQSALESQLAEAQSLIKIDRRASEMKLVPMKPEQVRYITIVDRQQAAAAESAPAATAVPTP